SATIYRALQSPLTKGHARRVDDGVRPRQPLREHGCEEEPADLRDYTGKTRGTSFRLAAFVHDTDLVHERDHHANASFSPRRAAAGMRRFSGMAAPLLFCGASKRSPYWSFASSGRNFPDKS